MCANERTGMEMQGENEQKFLVLKGILNNLGIGKEIVQRYICLDPPIRLRVENFREACFLTIKIRDVAGFSYEFEEKISLPYGEIIMRASKCHEITKTRYKLGPLEVDIFLGRLAGLVLIEFERRHQEDRAEIPAGFDVKEVTGDPLFENENLCRLEKLPKGWRCQDVSRSLRTK